MNAVTKIAPAAKLIALKGRNAAIRELAFMDIAPRSFAEATSRAASISNLKVALGNKPSAAELVLAQQEWIIGRVAVRLPASEVKGERLEFARALFHTYAMPQKAGSKAKLRKGKVGYRSEVQQKTIRAAESAWSLMKADLGLSDAQGQAEKNKKQRSTNNNPVRGEGKGADMTPTSAPLATAKPAHIDLVKPEEITADYVCNHVMTQASALLSFANNKKYAKLLPTDFGMAIHAFKTAINAAENKRQEAIAAANAK